MNGHKSKRIRKISKKAFDARAKSTIYAYVDRLCSYPFHKRLHYAWYFIRGINPHTGVRPEKEKK